MSFIQFCCQKAFLDIKPLGTLWKDFLSEWNHSTSPPVSEFRRITSGSKSHTHTSRLVCAHSRHHYTAPEYVDDRISTRNRANHKTAFLSASHPKNNLPWWTESNYRIDHFAKKVHMFSLRMTINLLCCFFLLLIFIPLLNLASPLFGFHYFIIAWGTTALQYKKTQSILMSTTQKLLEDNKTNKNTGKQRIILLNTAWSVLLYTVFQFFFCFVECVYENCFDITTSL